MMKPGVVSWLVFGVACAAQWLLPLASIRAREEVIAKGAVIRIAVTAPDPFDPLRGRYLRVRPKESEVLLPTELLHLRVGKKVWVRLKEGPDGLHHLGEVALAQSAEGNDLQMKLGHALRRNGESVPDKRRSSVNWPFDRFYVNEKLAPKADAWLRENTRGEKTVVAELRLLNGIAVLMDLSIDGRSFREILKQSAE
jgi:hypothetical protein